MKKELVIGIVSLSLLLMAKAGYGQGALTGPRIVHEEEEITVIEDGKEVEKHYVGKIGDQKMAIMKDAHDRKRTYKEKDIQPPKLKFYNENDKLVKEINLSSEKHHGKIKETRPGWKKGEFDVDIETVKRPLVSKQGKYAVMDNSTYGGIETGKIILYDTSGKALFEKQYPQGRSITNRMVISDSGTVALVTSEGAEGPQDPTLYVYDKTGKELLAYPAEGEDKLLANTKAVGKRAKKVKTAAESEKPDLIEVLQISSNGKYLAVRAGFEYKYTRTVFFDLEKKIFWKADRDYVVYEISDNGISKTYYQDEIKHEPSDIVTIDLSARIKP